MTARNPKYLCSLGLKILGEKTVSCDLSHPSMDVKETSLGFVIDNRALGAYGLTFTKTDCKRIRTVMFWEIRATGWSFNP